MFEVYLVLVCKVLASAVLLVLSSLHILWARGSTWPTSTEKDLLALVIGHAPRGKMPGVWPCLVVAAALGVTAAAVWGLESEQVSGASKGVLAVMAVVFVCRGLGGFVEARFRPMIRQTPYAFWSRRLYSPLSLSLGVMLGAVVLTFQVV